VALGAAETGARMLYVSTDYVFDGTKDRPWREKDNPNPLSVYGRSKLMGEKAVQRTGKRWFIVRTSWLYGRHGRNFVDTIRNKAGEVPELNVVTDQVGSPTWVRDLCEPLTVIGRSDRFGVYHLTNSGRCSWFEFAQEIVRLTGADCRVEPTDSAAFKRPAPRPAFSVLDNGQVKRRFGIRMRDWREALQEYLEDVSPAQAGG
jgi:dTDP-4-dehydrorhamnose reductase